MSTSNPPQPANASSRYAVITPRLYLEHLSPDEHLEDFHAMWSNSVAVKWSFVYLFALCDFIYCVIFTSVVLSLLACLLTYLLLISPRNQIVQA